MSYGNSIDERLKYCREEHLFIKRIDHYTLTIRDQPPPGLIYIENSVRSSEVLVIEPVDKDPLVWILEDLEPQKSIRLTYKAALDPTLEERLYTTAVKVHATNQSASRMRRMSLNTM